MMKFFYVKFICVAVFIALTGTVIAQESMTPAASFLGTHSYERVGYHLHPAGDVNRDGFDDFLIGTFHNQARGHDAGAAYLILGRKSPDWGFHFSLKNADARFIGDRAYDAVGYCLGGGGDVNGDGFDDIIIGAPAGNEEVISNPGHVYIVFGKEFPNWGHDFRLADQADASFDGEDQHNFAGLSLAIIGDVNQDGFDDIVCGSPFNDFGNTNGGKVHLILGKADGWGRDVNLDQADASFFGKRNEGLAGYAVDGVGDVNGDGVVDFAIGARGEAKVYLIFGRKQADWGRNFDLENADAIFYSDRSDDWTGWRVSRAGDINRDGFDDFLVGAPRRNGTQRDEGRVSLILGRAEGWFGNLNDADANFHGEDREDQAGWDVQDAGDVDGDGYDDFLIGAWQNDANGSDAGKMYLIEGRKSGWHGDISLADIETFYTGDSPGVYAGFSVASAGDVTGNGVSDIIASSTYDNEVDQWSGKINLFVNKSFAKRVTLPIVRAPKNSVIKVPILVENLADENIQSCQFQVRFNENVVETIGVSAQNTLMAIWENVDVNTDTAGSIFVRASGSASLAAGDTLLNLDFRVIGEVDDTTSLRFGSFLFNDGAVLSVTSDGLLFVDPPVLPPPAELTFSVSSLHFGIHHTSRTFSITNDTDSLLTWQAENLDKNLWDISVQPANGVLGIGESEKITVSINRDALDRGDYVDTLRITAENADNCPKSIPIILSARTWPVEVGRHRLFETKFISEKTANNPYTDVTLSVLLKNPSGDEITISGYWQEDSLWKCRVMPTETGKWTYTTTSEEPSLNGFSGEFICVDSDHPGVLVVNPNNPYSFALSETGPIFWMGETAWCLMSDAVPFSNGTFQKYIDARKGQGFNNIHFVLGTGGLPIGTDNPKNEGGNLWVSQSQNKLNPEFFKWMDKRVAYIDSSQMALGFFITWAQHFATFTKADFERLERYLIARYSAYPMLHWVVVGEFDEVGAADDYIYHGAVIKNADPYGHPVSIHPGHSDAANLGTNRIFAAQDWCDYIMHQLPRYPGQASASEINQQIVVDRIYDKPVVNIEFGYEDMDYLGRVMTGDDIRKYAWAIACGGGFPSYGHSKTIREIDFDAFESPGALCMQILKTFFEKIEWWHMEPHNEILDAGFCLGDENKRYVIYLPDSGRVKVDFSKNEGIFRGQWFNPKTGDVHDAPYVFGGEVNSFEAPFSDDAVLHVWAISEYGMKIAPDTLRFIAIQGGAIPSGQSVTISQIGEGTLSWTSSEQPEKSWLHIDKTQGGAEEQFTATVSTTGLTTGNFSGAIRIEDPKAVNSPINIPVYLKVYPPKIPRLAVSGKAINFGEKEISRQITIINAGNDSLRWQFDQISYPWIVSAEPCSGLLLEGEEKDIVVDVNRDGLAEDDYNGSLRIKSNGGEEDIAVSMTVPAQPAFLQRINCGSEKIYTDSHKNEWAADQPYAAGSFGYVGGKTYATSDTISGTVDDPLYQSERFGLSGYRFDVPEGQYTVKLHFAEVYFRSAERRLIRILLEGNESLKRLDIFAEAGHDGALSYAFTNVAVNDGRLDIQFQSIYEQPKISAIEVFSANTAPELSVRPEKLEFGSTGSSLALTITNIGGGTLAWSAETDDEHAWINSVQPAEGMLSATQSQTVQIAVNRSGMENGNYESLIQILSNAGNEDVPVTMVVAPTPKYAQRINCGSNENFKDSGGNDWSADRAYMSGGFGYVGGKTYSATDPIAGTSDDALYKSERWGLDGYRFDVPAGNYTVVLHFAEVYFKGAGRRVMDVSVEGQTVLSRFDIYGQAGHDAAFSKVCTNVGVSDGRLDIAFRAIVEEPKISAIEVFSASNDPVLSLSAGELNFGSTQNKMKVIVTNAGGGNLSWNAAEDPDESWITSISPASGTLDNGADTVTVTVSREGLDQATYEGVIQFTSEAGSQEVRVTMVVPGPPKLSVSPKILNFGANSTLLELTVSNTGGGTLNWSAIKNPSLVWISSIAPADGTLTADQSQKLRVTVDRSGLAEGEYEGIIAFNSESGMDSVAVNMLVSAAPAYAQRINCGASSDYVDDLQNRWEKDRAYSVGSFGYVGGKTYSVNDTIAGTDDDMLFQSERYGMQEYRFDVPEGVYQVKLHFAEIYFKENGRRLLGVSVEDERVLEQVDIFHEAGHDAALTFMFPNVTVSDGRLDIKFHAIYEQPKISAIEVVSASSDPILAVSATELDFGGSKTTMSLNITNSGGGLLNWNFDEDHGLAWLVSVEPSQGALGAGQSQKVELTIDRAELDEGEYCGKLLLRSNAGEREVDVTFDVLPPALYALRVNCGSKENYTDVNANLWLSDREFDSATWGYIGGSRYQAADEISDTENDLLFQSERWGLDGYAFNVENGFYEVSLLFAEIYFTRPGKRQFHVEIEGKNVLTNFDIFAESGHDQALVKTFEVVVADGQLNILFKNSVEDAKISAIQILGFDGKSVPKSAPDSTLAAEPILPNEFRVKQNYPNPFNPDTNIEYQIPEQGRVIVHIFNILGKEICTLVDEVQPAGFYTLRWNGQLSGLSSGVYFCRIVYKNQVETIKMSKLR